MFYNSFFVFGSSPVISGLSSDDDEKFELPPQTICISLSAGVRDMSSNGTLRR